MPVGLPLSLLCGCTALFACFFVPLPKYRNFSPLLTSPAQSEARDIAVRALGMEENGRPLDSTDNRRTSMIVDRVAINILARSGYLLSAESLTSKGSPPETQYSAQIDDVPFGCVDLTELPDSEELRYTAAQLAIAAVAVEKFHRNVLQRSVEWAYARAFSAVTGRLPDLSLGPAQIRPSEIRRVAAEVKSTGGPHAILDKANADLGQMLTDECQSLRLAAALMYHFLSKSHSSCERAENPNQCELQMAAAAYAGQRRAYGVISYPRVVAAMVNMFEGH